MSSSSSFLQSGPSFFLLFQVFDEPFAVFLSSHSCFLCFSPFKSESAAFALSRQGRYQPLNLGCLGVRFFGLIFWLNFAPHDILAYIGFFLNRKDISQSLLLALSVSIYLLPIQSNDVSHLTRNLRLNSKIKWVSQNLFFDMNKLY